MQAAKQDVVLAGILVAGGSLSEGKNNYDFRLNK